MKPPESSCQRHVGPDAVPTLVEALERVTEIGVEERSLLFVALGGVEWVVAHEVLVAEVAVGLGVDVAKRGQSHVVPVIAHGGLSVCW